jgi:hypothetical protein
VGVFCVVLGVSPLILRIRVAGIRLLGVAAIVIGLGLVSPWLLLLAVPPAVIVVNRRRKRLRADRLISAERTSPAEELADWSAAYEAAGFRYAASLQVRTSVGGFPLAIHRLPDLRGWIEMTPYSVEIQHQFAGHHFSTVDSRALPRPRRHLLQLCASPDFETRLAEHRRLLARLARMGYRPDRLDDEEVLAIVGDQIERSYRETKMATWRDALVFTYWEERATQGQVGCVALADDRRCDRKLAAWLAE